MELKISDYNDAEGIIKNEFSEEWKEFEKILQEMPLHLQGSDQKGKKGSVIFGVKETNRYLKEHLVNENWEVMSQFLQNTILLGLV